MVDIEGKYVGCRQIAECAIFRTCPGFGQYARRMVQSVCLSVMEGQPLALHGAFPSLDIFICSPAVQEARNTRCSEIQSSGVYAPSAADRAIHAFAHRTWTR